MSVVLMFELRVVVDILVSDVVFVDKSVLIVDYY